MVREGKQLKKSKGAIKMISDLQYFVYLKKVNRHENSGSLKRFSYSEVKCKNQIGINIRCIVRQRYREIKSLRGKSKYPVREQKEQQFKWLISLEEAK